MSVFVSLTSRTGDVAGPIIFCGVVPRIGEHVSFMSPDGDLKEAQVVKVKHAMDYEQRARMMEHETSQVRVYVFLDEDDAAFRIKQKEDQ